VAGFGSSGFSSLKYRGAELLNLGTPIFYYVNLTDSNGNLSSAGFSNATTVVQTSTKTVTTTYAWGGLQCVYTVSGDHLQIEVRLTNTSSKTVRDFMFELMQLRFPSMPAGYDGNVGFTSHTVGGPLMFPVAYSSGMLVVTSDDVTTPVMAAMPWALNRPTSTIFPLIVNTGLPDMYSNSLPHADAPIAPGQTRVMQFSLRFGPAGSDPLAMAADLFATYRATFPRILDWPDSRSIGTVFLSNSGQGWAKNPRGWFNDSSLDVTTTAGKADLRQRFLDTADRCIANLQTMDSQGIVAWDIEGGEFPHAITYIGDPRIAETLAPELDGILDEFFRRFRDAGLRVGVTIRPQQFSKDASGNGHQDEVADFAALLDAKVTYAKQRWGATLFYVDSNGDANSPMDATAFRQLAAKHSDVLFIPEMKTPLYHSFSAPYQRLDVNTTTSTPARMLAVYPDALSTIYVPDGDIDANHAALVESVRRGDILMYRAWFNDSANPKVKAIYTEAGR
jgi:hypothetical protein